MIEEANDTPSLQRLAAGIERAGLATPARLLLDVIAPLDILSAQMALFAAPFTTGSRFKEYTSVLSNERSWQELRRILSQRT